MKKDIVIVDKTISASASNIWDAFTDVTKLKQWFFNVSDFKPELGFQFTFVGIGNEGFEYRHECEVTMLVPNKKLQYSWKYAGYEGNSMVTFDFIETETKSVVRVTHNGLASFPDSSSFQAESFIGGWTALIQKMLPEFLEKK
jgi:uncharacterized protein YndB with AHSA1/START domain